MYVIEFNGRLIGPFHDDNEVVGSALAAAWAYDNLGQLSWMVRPLSAEHEKKPGWRAGEREIIRSHVGAPPRPGE